MIRNEYFQHHKYINLITHLNYTYKVAEFNKKINLLSLTFYAFRR